jgi:hypothetical protein
MPLRNANAVAVRQSYRMQAHLPTAIDTAHHKRPRSRSTSALHSLGRLGHGLGLPPDALRLAKLLVRLVGC